MREHGYQTREQILGSIDECLEIAFAHSGDGINFERDLVIPDAPEPDFDKFPKWFPGTPLALKRRIGRHMAKVGAPSVCPYMMRNTGGAISITFTLPDGSQSAPFTTSNQNGFQDFPEVRRMEEINRMNRISQERLINERQPTQSSGASPGASPFSPAMGGHRHYMAGLGRWMTQAAYEMQLAGERPYAYAE